MEKLRDFFSKKKIIFFCVQTFSLEKQIKRKLEELGAQVDYYDERPSNSNFTKGIIRLKRSIYQRKIDKYYQDILARSSTEKFDFLFVNRGEVIPSFFLEQFKKQHPECFFIFYTWDSFANHEHPKTIIKYFDRRLTFDPQDAKEYHISFRPLFFLDVYKHFKSEAEYKYNLLFLGTAHSDRYRISTAVSDWCSSRNLSSFCYYYMHGKLVYFYKKAFDKTFGAFDYKKLNFTPLNVEQILALYKTSQVILDINHPNQKGLTMRTFEALGAGKKLITTNREIKKFPFYNSNNVYIIDREDINLDEAFFQSSYIPVEANIYDRFSLEGWLHNIFVDTEDEFWNKIT